MADFLAPDPLQHFLDRGYATGEEIFAADYGEWPPKGLDIIAAPHERIPIIRADINREIEPRTLQDIVRDLFRRIRGHVSSPAAADGSIIGPRRIRIDIRTAELCGLMGHEAVHSVQGDNAFRRLGRKRDIRSREIIADLLASDARAAKGAPNPMWQEDWRTYSDVRGVRGLDYYRDGLEIQARLHEVLAQGYRQWGRLPQDRTELYAALVAIGLDAPAFVRDRLAQTAEGQKACALFKPLPASDQLNSVAGDINFIARTFKRESTLNAYWHRGLPDLYGDLIEMYGDKKGSIRLGYGANFKLDERILSLIATDNAKLSDGEVADYLRQANPYMFADLVHESIRECGQRFYNPPQLEAVNRMIRIGRTIPGLAEQIADVRGDTTNLMGPLLPLGGGPKNVSSLALVACIENGLVELLPDLVREGVRLDHRFQGKDKQGGRIECSALGLIAATYDNEISLAWRLHMARGFERLLRLQEQKYDLPVLLRADKNGETYASLREVVAKINARLPDENKITLPESGLAAPAKLPSAKRHRLPPPRRAAKAIL